MTSSIFTRAWLCAVATLWLTAPLDLGAQPLGGTALVSALREGGYVIVMRHASSPREAPAKAEAAPGNVDLQRQLDQAGLASAAAMGTALKRLGIPVGQVLSSPTFRAIQTAKQLDLGAPVPVEELGDGGQNMRADTEGRRSAWLREKAAEPPPAGTNRLLITHVPNLAGAFGDAAAGMTDGESLIVKPERGKGEVVARVKIADWSKLPAGGVALADDDPYAWLEDIHAAKPLAWVAEQNAKTFGELKADPRYAADFASMLAVLDAADRIPFGDLDHGSVYNFWQDADHSKGLWRRAPVEEYAKPAPSWEVLLDVDALAAAEKEDWVFKGAECAPRGTRCLIRLSRGGGDAVVVREYDLEGKKLAADGFALTEAKSNATYLDDDTVLFGTDFGAGTMTKSGYPRIVKEWKRGTPLAAARTVYEGPADDVGSSPVVFHDRNGDHGVVTRSVSFFESEYFAIGRDGARKLALPPSADLKGMFDGAYIATLREDYDAQGVTLERGSLVAFRDKGPPRALYVPDARSTIDSVAVGRDAIYAAIYSNVVGSVHAFTRRGDGWTDETKPLPANGSTGIVSVDSFGPEAMFRFESYLTPPTLYLDDGRAAPRAIKAQPARFDADGLVTEQLEATSKDGTRVPYFVVRPKTLSGPTPTVLYGYGGFEISLTPSYSSSVGRLWLTRGGVYVVANIRGGGEFGPAWHDAALKLHRQRAFDDFEAVAADLTRRGLTTPRQLGIMGGSNGGLLVSTVMTQIPDELGAVVCSVPLIDMIAYTHIGAGASWVGEYGDPADPKMREYISSYSPYQNVKPDVRYPPVLFVTTTSDDRVTPAHARKMAAKMEAQGHDVLFYEDTDGGHGTADHKQAAETAALNFTFLARELGLH
jgi:prolyl oligopeptidase